MNLIIFGPPGSGKGTYASRLETKLEIIKISTGDIFRENIKNDTELGKKVESVLAKGQLVPDDITIEILKDRISKTDVIKKGFILDGYPRTVPQAKVLDKITKIDAIINLKVPLQVILVRLSGRLHCRAAEHIYHKKFLKPKKPGVCDVDGSELYQRNDDKPNAIKVRFKAYESQTKPVLDYYKNKLPIVKVSCNKADVPPDVMVNKILMELKRLKLN